MSSNSSTLVFPVNSDGTQSSDLPVRINNQFTTRDIVQGYYLNDLWRWSPEFAINMGLRLDSISGFTSATQLDLTLNRIWDPSEDTTVHAGLAHYMNTPAFQAFSPAAQASFNARPTRPYRAGSTHSLSKIISTISAWRTSLTRI